VKKTYVITGASSGIGAALARAWARRGDNLVLAARSVDELAKLAKQCGPNALAVKTDVTDPAQCEAMVKAAVERFGGIDVLVNNAGISMWARFRDITDLTLFERIMRVNYLGTVYSTHYALPHLIRSRGLVVGISSLTGKTGVPTRSGYSASKHAMQGFLDSIRIELRDTGVDVLVVSPGFVKTDIRSKLLGPNGQSLDASPRDESEGMSVDECTAIILRAVDHRAREVVMTPRGKIGMWLKLVAPGLVDRIAERAVREKN
jgi:NAD(P)-dependent dehydrogenase (short-subunit alcohol dehydrogenase family)